MQAYLLLGPFSIELNNGVSSFINTNPLLNSKTYPKQRNHTIKHHQCPGSTPVASAAINNSKRNHYDVLGVSARASAADIKKAYRALARKYHPDVSKDSQAGETFKVIRLAYDVLSNVETRAQYDQGLQFQENSRIPWRQYQNQTYNPEFDEGVRVYRWAELRRQMRREKYWKQYESGEYTDSEEEYEDEALDNDRGSFSEVLAFTFFTLFFMKTIGTQFTLMLCSFAAMLDRKLDSGYKMGYLLAWVMGGRGGVLLSLCISFVSWACGKTSSSLVALMVVAMWVGTNLSRYVPLPQGALIALLYMSVKLQADSS